MLIFYFNLYTLLMSKTKSLNCHTSSGAVYGLGMIGAVVYYLQHATTVGEGLIGILKAIVWPAFLIYRVFTNLQL